MRRHRKAFWPLLVCLFFGMSAGAAQTTGHDQRARAVRTSSPLRIDGYLDDPAWSTAIPFSDFLQSEPIEGALPTERSEVRILFDDEALYLGAVMYDSRPDSIVARLSRRDDQIVADFLSFRFDTFLDHQTAYEFTVSAAGTKIDILIFDDGDEEDVTWDAVWDAETVIGPDGWTAEIRIPFTMLRFIDAAEQEWGMQVIRWITRKQEIIEWALRRKAESGMVSRYGHLLGLKGIEPRTSLELLPYGVLESSRLAAREGKARSVTTTLDAGVDLKYRPTPNLTIDATVNPDFGQVEADPAVLNLSTFETFYPERRPFFVEGVQIFRFATFGNGFGPGMFYSRRIGRSIDIDPPVGGYVERSPGFASILGAVKVSGKTESGLSYGVLEAVTQEEYGDVVDSLGARSRVKAEPATNYALVRLRQDFGENSNAGMILTNVTRPDRIPAITGGFDWDVKLAENMYQIDGFLALSRTARTGELLEGSAGKLEFAKTGGEHWRGNLSTDFTSRRYNINDIGFFRRPGDWGGNAEVQYRDDVPGKTFRVWNMKTSVHRRMNMDNILLFQRYGLSGFFRFLNYWELAISGSVGEPAYDDRETRGLGLFRKAATREARVNVESDPRADVVLDVSYEIKTDTRGARDHRIEAELELKPLSELTFEVSLEFGRADKTFAWVTNLSDPSVEQNAFSVFADRYTRSWDVQTRGTYVFTRDITLQWFLQMFVAKGRYEEEMRRLGIDAYTPYAYASQDFTSYAVHSNLVLRWEYMPGSTLFLAWSHGREGGRPLFVESLNTNLDDTFRLPPDNVFLLKIAYWFSAQ